jgi:hypothetical protein
MMTAARDIISGAYRRLGLLPLGADLDPERAAAGLAAYNDMLNAWAADGIFPGGPNPPVQHTDGTGDIPAPPAPAPLAFSLGDAFPFLPQFTEGAKAILAMELASASGIEAQPSTQKRAQKAYAALLAYYVIAPGAGQDIGLTWMPSLRRYGFR